MQRYSGWTILPTDCLSAFAQEVVSTTRSQAPQLTAPQLTKPGPQRQQPPSGRPQSSNQTAPITNAGVIRMVKAGVPESPITASIQSSPVKFDLSPEGPLALHPTGVGQKTLEAMIASGGVHQTTPAGTRDANAPLPDSKKQSRPAEFDTSPDGLIALHKAGATQNEMDAIMAASFKGPAAAMPRPVSADGAAAANAGPGAASSSSASKPRMPKVTVSQAGASRDLPLEKTQLAQTKTKPSSMKSLAADSVVTQGMQAGINTATMSAASHMNSGVGGSSVLEAGSIFSGIMARRKPTVTYVWGVPNPVSTSVLQTQRPTFYVDFSQAPGVNPDDFEPAVVKLTPAQNTWRIVGASEGKEDARSSPAADWQIYSSFLEERVRVNSQKVKSGQYNVSPSSPLIPGEYAVVLRPVSKSKKFSGGDVARGQDDGSMFDAVWSFQVSADAE